jgi:drug/metabolite transporter (DMT)-like permease
MDWLLCIAIAVFASACGIFIDNYISGQYFKCHEANAQKSFYWFPFILIGIISVIIGILAFGDVNLAEIPIWTLILFMISGACTSIAGIFYYKALEVSESTDYGIFAQLSPVFYLILGMIFLNQEINTHQFIAFIIIFAAPILILLTTKKRSRHLRMRAVFYTILDILIDTSGAIMFVKFSNADINFAVQIGFVFIGKGIGNLIIMLANPKWRKRYRYVVKSSNRKVYLPLFGSLLASLFNTYARNIALVLAPSVAIASAITDSTRPILIFFLGLLFTLLWPKFGREKMSKKVILVHLIATVLVVVGICLIQCD